MLSAVALTAEWECPLVVGFLGHADVAFVSVQIGIFDVRGLGLNVVAACDAWQSPHVSQMAFIVFAGMALHGTVRMLTCGAKFEIIGNLFALWGKDGHNGVVQRVIDNW